MMFDASVIIHENTSACPGGRVSPTNRCCSCNEPAHVRIGMDSTLSTESPYSNVAITVVRDGTEEIVQEARKSEKLKPTPYRPLLKPVKDVWRSRWRLVQQRPRDGLR